MLFWIASLMRPIQRSTPATAPAKTSSSPPLRGPESPVANTVPRLSDQSPAEPTPTETTLEDRYARLNQNRAIAATMDTLSVSRLLSEWGATSNDHAREAIILNSLRYKIRTAGLSETDQQTILSILNRSQPFSENALAFIRAIGATQTPETTQILLSLLDSIPPGEDRRLVLELVANTGSNHWNGSYHDELSPVVERAWKQPGHDSETQQALAKALGEIGAESGIQLLLDQLETYDGNFENLRSQPDARFASALQGLSKVDNPSSIPPLANWLRSSEYPEWRRDMAGTTLAQMGSPRATEVLLEWALTASDTDTEQATAWFNAVRDSESHDFLTGYLLSTPEETFTSQAVREAIIQGLGRRMPSPSP